MTSVVYLDHAASTPIRPAAVQAMVTVMSQDYANPSGAHLLARSARRTLDDARARLAAVVGAETGDVIFCSGGTEADNLAVRGLSAAGGGSVLVCATEHHAVLDPATGLGATLVPVGRDGRVDLDRFADLCSPEVGLVSIMLVNNETGVIQDLAAIRKVMRKRSPSAVLHTDAVQGLCWLDLRTVASGADAISIGAHKIGGPRGIGALVVRDGVALQAQMLGGGQERERRSGTQDVASAVGFAVAAEATDQSRAAEVERISELRDALLDGLVEAVDGLNPTVADRSITVPGIVHVCIEGIESEALLFLLERHEVMASAASSCASGAQERSHVLMAMGVDPGLAGGALRLSLGHTSSPEDIERALIAIPETVERLRGFGL